MFKTQFRLLSTVFFTFRILLTYYFYLIISKFLFFQSKEKYIEKVHIKIANKIYKKILKKQGLFIKLGQYISIVGFLFSREFARIFESLQDQVPPVSYDIIRQRFLKEFGFSPEVFFLYFDKAPIASASLGQVHKAITYEGNEVAVKILYPYVEELVERDLRCIFLVMKVVFYFFPVYDANETFNEFSTMIFEELDYIKERKNLYSIRDKLIDYPQFFFPRVYEAYSSKKILTTEFVHGIKITDFDGLKSKHINLEKLSEHLILAYFQMVLIHHEFHADPHPGNLFVLGEKDNIKIAFIDFGSVKKLKDIFKKQIFELFEYLFNNDIEGIIYGLKKMGIVIRNRDPQVLEKIELVLIYFLDAAEDLQDLNSQEQFEKVIKMFDHLKKTGLGFREILNFFKTPSEYVYLWRTLSLVFSLAGRINMKKSPMQTAFPFIKDYLLEKKKKTMQNFSELKDSFLKDFLFPIYQIPKSILRTIYLINQDRFKMQVLGFDRWLVLHIAKQILIFFLLLIFIFLAVFFHQQDSKYYRDLFTGISSFLLSWLFILLFKTKS